MRHCNLKSKTLTSSIFIINRRLRNTTSRINTAQTYNIEFKEEACKRVQSGVPAAQVARELGVNVNTLYTWMSRFKEHPVEPFVGSGNLHHEYCALDYQALVKEHGFISSLSRKGNCWDNAPMESFWGKLKQEWLNGQHFRTREEAKAAVFEYIWIFYNRKRIHEANGYLTLEEYYRQHQTDLKAA